jgi:hypothetical protein
VNRDALWVMDAWANHRSPPPKQPYALKNQNGKMTVEVWLWLLFMLKYIKIMFFYFFKMI